MLVSGGPLSGTGLTLAALSEPTGRGQWESEQRGVQAPWLLRDPRLPRRGQAGARSHRLGHTASVPWCLSCRWPPRPSSSLLGAPPLLRMPPARLRFELCSWLLLPVFLPPPFGGSEDHLPVYLAPALAQALLLRMCPDCCGAAPVTSLMRKPVLCWNVTSDFIFRCGETFWDIATPANTFVL